MVTVLDRSAAGCAELNEAHGTSIATYIGDVRERADNRTAVKLCLERFSRLDCAIGNAGIWDYTVPLVDIPAEKLGEAFDELFRTNVPGLLDAGQSSSPSAHRTLGIPHLYGVQRRLLARRRRRALYWFKASVCGLIRQPPMKLAPHVRVNGVAPGGIATQLKGPAALGMHDNTFPGEQLAMGAPTFVPLGKLPTPDEYAGAYVFFASCEDNVPATGAILNHDGGFGVRGILPVPRGGDDLKQKLGLDPSNSKFVG